jgi:hypothetical protein
VTRLSGKPFVKANPGILVRNDTVCFIPLDTAFDFFKNVEMVLNIFEAAVVWKRFKH